MASDILTIYSGLEDVNLMIKRKQVRCYGLNELPQQISSAQLPCRLLLPLGQIAAEGREGQFISIGKTLKIDWTVSDLFLMQTSEQGTGLASFGPGLVEYCGLYADAIRAFRNPTNNCTLTSVSLIPGMYEWPRGSGSWFVGVMSNLIITEVLYG